MNKLAQYLNQHLDGEVAIEPGVLDAFSKDNSPLTMRPQMVAFPTNVNDVRKLLRFAWQLAEKGHTLPVTVRGGGKGISGAAVGNGVVVVTERALAQIAEHDGKQHLLRLQPGASSAAIQSALGLQMAWLPDFLGSDLATTIGGYVANCPQSSSFVKELEVILPNGDVLHTKRLTKREFSKKRGEQSLEGNIYRSIDALIEENSSTIESELDDTNYAGYSGLAEVRGRDGSFDLTPLVIGSQGTLGIISEMIVATEYQPAQLTVITAAFSTFDDARDALDGIAKQQPFRVAFIDSSTLERAAQNGKTLGSQENVAVAALVITLSDSSPRLQLKKQKKIEKLLNQFKAEVGSPFIGTVSEYPPAYSLLSAGSRAQKTENKFVTVASDLYIPIERFEEMTRMIAEISQKRRVELSITGEPLKNRWRISAELRLTTTAGRQTLLSLIDDLAALAEKLGGALIGGDGEGRIGAVIVDKKRSENLKKLDEAIKAAFDPHGILNPGVKQAANLQDLIKQIG